MLTYFVEFLGTFVFLSVILSSGSPLPVVIALAAAIYFGGDISGGHFNPAVSTMMYMDNRLSREDWLGYLVAQVAGGAAALYFYKYAQANKRA